MKTDILIVGCGCSGLYCALNLPSDKNILIITKSDIESSDSFLAQGGMCMLTGADDYESYFEDTLRAGHYANDKRSVDIMIRSSVNVVRDLLSFGAMFNRDENGRLALTREGAHSAKRIIFHEDTTGREITSRLLAQVRTRKNITIMENTAMLDIVTDANGCRGAVIRMCDGQIRTVQADYTVWATGGVGGIYRHSTNFRHLTGDAVAIAAKHSIKLKDMECIQIHPTTLYSEREEDRSFLISESVRGEGARLYDKNMNRFVNELLPRDLLTEAIYAQMEKDRTDFVWEDLRTVPQEELKKHFPNIIQHCLNCGYDVTRQCIPVVPAQHYFMGGIKVNHESRTSMNRLYAIGETACNGVHGKNRLASNSLLESLVFAKRAAADIISGYNQPESDYPRIDLNEYADEKALSRSYRSAVINEIEKAGGTVDARKDLR